MFSRLRGKTRFYTKLVISTTALFICLSYGLILSLSKKLMGRNDTSMWSTCRLYAGIVSKVTGIRIVIDGVEQLQTKPAVFVMNHQT